MTLLGDHVPRAERVERGLAARKAAPRSSHGEWAPAADRPDPILLLEQQAETRVPELVPMRYGRMLVSPFAFYRGAAAIMASDLASHTGVGLPGTGVRRRPPLELRDLRDSRAEVRLRHERLRRDASGAVGVGRQAPRRELRRRRARGRPLAQAARPRRRRGAPARTGGRCGRSPTVGPCDVWYAHLQVHDLLRELRSEFSAERLVQVEADVAKAQTRDSIAGAEEADRPRGRRTALHRRPAADRHAGEPLRRGGLARDRGRGRGDDRLLPLGAVAGAARPARPVPPRPRSAQGGRRRQRRNPCLGRSVRRHRMPTIR